MLMMQNLGGVYIGAPGVRVDISLDFIHIKFCVIINIYIPGS